MKNLITLIIIIVATPSIAGVTIISTPGDYVTQPKIIDTVRKKDTTKATQNEIERLENIVKPISVSDRETNLFYYKQLLKLDPENYEYKQKVSYYSKPHRKIRSGVTIEQLLE